MPTVIIATLESHEVVVLARVPLVGERVHVPHFVHDARVRLVVHTPSGPCAAVAYVVECQDEPSARLRARTRQLTEIVRDAPEPTSNRARKREHDALRR